MVKIKLLCKEENYIMYQKMLEKAGFIISDDAELTFKEDDFNKENFLGQRDDLFEIIHYDEISYIESFGHEIFCYTKKAQYRIKERLYEIEELLRDKGFVRINKSQIINKSYIKEIKPTFNTRIILILKGNEKVYVSRNYYQDFRMFIGF